ncbi:hypothetical protein [Haloarcula halophila]|uniref:hypothetical protein n=1 Tax=Haloarcula TaxID=2237 RepID=UPI0023E4421B|nr:hypothetical protein [Halomicroarcula sp. DFY41]
MRDTTTRRGFLSLVGVGALAGCSALDNVTDSEEPRISTYGFPDVEDDEYPDRPVPPSVPVDIGTAHLEAERSRTTSLLSELPTPLGPDDIPNGHIRGHLTSAAADARANLDEALQASTELTALTSLRQARERARYAAEGWAFVTDGRTVPELRRERSEAVSSARSFREQYEYVGDDPVRAAVVHGEIEETLEHATDEDRVHVSHGGTLLTVAEWGEEIESVQARLDSARHLAERFTESLPADVGTVEAVLRSAQETLAADVEQRQSGLPPEQTADEWGPREELLDSLRWRAEDSAETVRTRPGPASGVVDGARLLSVHGASDRVQQRLDEGESFRVESREAVQRYRQTAHEALQTALEDSQSTPLARAVVSDASSSVSRADWELGRLDGDVRASRVEDAVVGYVIATAMARATPTAVDRAVEVLESA